jgi:hypothetical protein
MSVKCADQKGHMPNWCSTMLLFRRPDRWGVARPAKRWGSDG